MTPLFLPPLKGLAGVAVLDGVQLLNAKLRWRIAPEGSGAVRRIPFGKSEANPYRPPLASPGGVAERSESFKIMIASGNHTLIQ